MTNFKLPARGTAPRWHEEADALTELLKASSMWHSHGSEERGTLWRTEGGTQVCVPTGQLPVLTAWKLINEAKRTIADVQTHAMALAMPDTVHSAVITNAGQSGVSA